MQATLVIIPMLLAHFLACHLYAVSLGLQIAQLNVKLTPHHWELKAESLRLRETRQQTAVVSTAQCNRLAKLKNENAAKTTNSASFLQLSSNDFF